MILGYTFRKIGGSNSTIPFIVYVGHTQKLQNISTAGEYIPRVKISLNTILEKHFKDFARDCKVLKLFDFDLFFFRCSNFTGRSLSVYKGSSCILSLDYKIHSSFKLFFLYSLVTDIISTIFSFAGCFNQKNP